jgi:RNA polymerase sigma-70 factor, ECF subfamily
MRGACILTTKGPAKRAVSLSQQKRNILRIYDRAAAEDAGATKERLLKDMAGLRLQLTRITKNGELADDLLQDAIVTALQKLAAGELSDERALDGFVYRVALNHLRNYRRRDRSAVSDQEDGLVDTEAHSMAENLCSAQWARVMREVLEEVKSTRDRELLVRFYLREEPKEPLCEEFGLTELHFNRVIFRARERFRELLSRRGFGKADFLSLIALVIP